MHWRRVAVSTIPLSDPDAFNAWLLNQWRVKEGLIEHYALNGRFPAEGTAGGDGWIETEVKLGSLWEIGEIFAPTAVMAAVVTALVAAYNQVRYGSVWGLG